MANIDSHCEHNAEMPTNKENESDSQNEVPLPIPALAITAKLDGYE